MLGETLDWPMAAGEHAPKIAKANAVAIAPLDIA